MPRSLRSWRTASAVAAAALALSIPTAAGAARAPSTALFSSPSGIAAVGSFIVVADHGSSSLTILAASDGALVGRVAPALLDVPKPTSIVAEVVGTRRIAFVAGTGGAVAELALSAKGAVVAVARLGVLRPKGCARSAAAYLATDAHGHVVEACATGEVVEWSAATGHEARAIAPSTTRLTDAAGLAVLGTTAYVTNDATAAAHHQPDGVTALSLATGRRLRAVTNATNAAYGFSQPAGISSDGTHLWVANRAANTVDELARGSMAFLAGSGTNLTAPATVLATPKFTWVSSASVNGSSSMVTQFYVVDKAIASPWMMCNSNGPYQFGDPSGFTMSGTDLWVANAANNLVDQMNGSTGALVNTYT
jgi:hypothetical protein